MCIVDSCNTHPPIHIYYCMTGRAVWGDIPFEAGRIGQTKEGTIPKPRTECLPVLPDRRNCYNRFIT